MNNGNDLGGWILCSEELPPCDGTYEVSDYPDQDQNCLMRHLITLGYYDGYGFQFSGIYKEPKYWRDYKKREVRYGKVKK